MRVMNWMLRRKLDPDGERGAVVAIVVLSLIALFGMIVLTVDVGGLLFKRRELVNGADAAALAGAQSCAKLDPGSVNSQVDGKSVANVSPDAGLTAAITALVNCTSSARGIGYITVRLDQNKELYFAPVLGFNDRANVVAEATAAWGVAAAGYAIPIVVEAGKLQGECDIPTQSQEPGSLQDCALWYNNDELGNADWGYMNLDQWDVDGAAQCSNAGSSNRSDWVFDGYGSLLSLKGDPPGNADTYVCVDTGHTTRDWQDLFREKGEVKLFPVNLCAPSGGLTGQVDKNGGAAPCPQTPDKYDIIGFVPLMIGDVLKGDNPLAIGTPGTTGTCSDRNLDLDLNQVVNLDSFGISNNCFNSAPDNIAAADVHVFPQTGPEFKQCLPDDFDSSCNYWYDESSRDLTWRSPAPITKAQITFDWSNNGTEGACGSRPSDPNAICLVTKWSGALVQPGPICEDCTDFGARAIRLCDLDIPGSCPGRS